VTLVTLVGASPGRRGRIRRVTRTTAPGTSASTGAARGSALVATAIVLTGLNLRTAVTTVGPVLEELQHGLGLSSGQVGLVTATPVLGFAAIGFAGPPLSARFRDSHVLAGAMATMAAGLVLRAVAGQFPIFLVGTVLAMVGGALGNVLLPALVKRYFPTRPGLLVGAYSTAMTTGAALAAVAAAPIAAAAGPADGWRWAIGVWALLALVTALPWLAVPARPATGRSGPSRVRLRRLAHSPLAVALALFFGLQAVQAFVVVGWTPQYLRDAGLSASSAGLLLGINTIVVIPLNGVVPPLTVRPRLRRPMLAVFVACYIAGWLGLWMAPLAAPLLWMVLLAIGLASFAMVLALIGLRARNPETTAALSTFAQGWGYVLAGLGPLLVGVLHGLTGSYTGMFVVVLTAGAGFAVSGWLVCRERYVDDELGLPAARQQAVERDVIEVAGDEPPVVVRIREPGGGSRLG
jgi:MFS transporter, CP family, cyanate transporter